MTATRLNPQDARIYTFAYPDSIVFRAIAETGQSTRQIEIKAKSNGDLSVDYNFGNGWHGEKVIAHW